MILVDKDIKKLITEENTLIVKNYDENNIHSISYDLTLDKIILGKSNQTNEYIIKPDEMVYVQTKEILQMPNNLLGRIAERNSVMRMGLFVSGPHYQPGHNTCIFLRVVNMSKKEIILKEGFKIAQIMFEELHDIPFHTYNSTFQNEFNYSEFGEYEDQYKEYISQIEKATEKLDRSETKIYGNTLTLLGIFISIFALISFNFGAIQGDAFSLKHLIAIDVSLGFIITIFMGLIFLFLNYRNNRNLHLIFGGLFALLFIATIVILLLL